MKRLFYLTFILYVLSSFAVVDNADIATPGFGLTKIQIGKTTFEEIKNIFGKTKIDKPTSGKNGTLAIPFYSLSYPDTGLTFIADKSKIVSAIEIIAPYKVKTDLGVTIGTEKRTVLKLYGKPKSDDGGTLIYDGITLGFENGIRCFGQPDIGTEQDLDRQVYYIQLYAKEK